MGTHQNSWPFQGPSVETHPAAPCTMAIQLLEAGGLEGTPDILKPPP